MAEGRRVRRVVRRVNPWSVLKVSFLFHASLVMVLLLAGVLLWAAGSALGAVDSTESFIGGLWAEQNFHFAGDQLLRGFVAAGLVLVVLGTGTAVLAAVLYNLISDVVGGIELTVLEESLRPPPGSVPVPEASQRPARPAEDQVLASG